MSFGGMPDLCYRNPAVYTAILENAEWLINEVGFNGFRFDFVKGYGGWMARAIQELRGLRGETAFKPFAVGECWDNSRTIEDWLNETNAWSDNPVHAFDFPLRCRLRDLCQVYGFSLRGLIEGGTVLADNPAHAVTFVENHEVLRNDPIVHDKMLAYAYILTHPGYSCVFWEGDFAYVGHMRPPEGISIGTAKECGMEKMHYRRMDEGTDADFAVLRHVHEQTLRALPDRLFAMLRDLSQDTAYNITRYDHCLQTATRALRDNRGEEYVVMALLHDVCEPLGPFNHGEVVAAILRPFISRDNHWMLVQHGLFQTYFYARHMGLDPNARDIYKSDPAYEQTVEFCAKYDEISFDPDYKNEPLSTFEPMVRRLLQKSWVAPSQMKPT